MDGEASMTRRTRLGAGALGRRTLSAGLGTALLAASMCLPQPAAARPAAAASAGLSAYDQLVLSDRPAAY
ncbi:hypothetical protein [Nonomuraea zeae]|uniref:Uncharacterized protein n=2 Tax=Nonomuraea zeae TaxID=1642303 RepID=A0A5S4H2C3_9ACTN|nr:hypothetical protein [Nonomuraea zeae]TMR39393.1 hypothetical protein ETD85_01730 [Nonomuraea zeae]